MIFSKTSLARFKQIKAEFKAKNSPPEKRGPAVCNRQKMAQNVKRTRAVRDDVPSDLRPLFNHIVRLAVHSAKNGYCTRAGKELAQARRLARSK